MNAPGTYRFTDINGTHVDGEIWSMGPKAKTLWVLGPDGPAVVHVETHRQVKYVIPTYHPNSHLWFAPGSYSAPGTSMTPMDCRAGKNPVGVAKWNALTVAAKVPDTLAEVLALPLNWDLTLDLTALGCPTTV